MTSITAPTGSFEIRIPFDFIKEGIEFPQKVKDKMDALYHTLKMDTSGAFTVDYEQKRQLYKDIMTETYGPEFFDENGVALVRWSSEPYHADIFVNESGESIFGNPRLLHVEHVMTKAVKKWGIYLLYIQPDTDFGSANFGENYFKNPVLWTPTLGRINNGDPVESINFNFAKEKWLVIVTKYDNKKIYLDTEGNLIEKPERYGQKTSFSWMIKDIFTLGKKKKTK